MGAYNIYYLLFILVPGIVVLAAVWYFLYSHYCHRSDKSRAVAILLATAEVAVLVLILAWIIRGQIYS